MTTVADAQDVSAFYQQIGDGRFRSTIHSQGAWDEGQQHMAPVAGLMVRAIEGCQPRDDLMVSRIAFDILGVIPTGEVRISCEVLRPGRTIELVQAEMTAAGRTVVRATAWRLAVSDTSDFAALDIDPLPGPEEGSPWYASDVWEGGYIRAVEFRVLPGWRPGRGQAWLRTAVDLVEGRESSSLARFIGLVDTANGIAVRSDPRTLLFPNTDLTVHLVRVPQGSWVGFDTTVSYGPDGVGMTAAVLYDELGPVGRAAQTLTLRARGPVRPPAPEVMPPGVIPLP